eukprot:12328297-Alexandrium_andersonii.AAC.1
MLLNGVVSITWGMAHMSRLVKTVTELVCGILLAFKHLMWLGRVPHAACSFMLSCIPVSCVLDSSCKVAEARILRMPCDTWQSGLQPLRRS